MSCLYFLSYAALILTPWHESQSAPYCLDWSALTGARDFLKISWKEELLVWPGLTTFCLLKMIKKIFLHCQLKALRCNGVKIVVWSSKVLRICCGLGHDTDVGPNRLRLGFFSNFRNMKRSKLELASGQMGPRFSYGILWPIIMRGWLDGNFLQPVVVGYMSGAWVTGLHANQRCRCIDMLDTGRATWAGLS